jgi:hypothetical protein
MCGLSSVSDTLSLFASSSLTFGVIQTPSQFFGPLYFVSFSTARTGAPAASCTAASGVVIEGVFVRVAVVSRPISCIFFGCFLGAVSSVWCCCVSMCLGEAFFPCVDVNLAFTWASWLLSHCYVPHILYHKLDI